MVGEATHRHRFEPFAVHQAERLLQHTFPGERAMRWAT
jgi:hypothetical protein